MRHLIGIFSSQLTQRIFVTGGTLSSDSNYYYRTFTSTNSLTIAQGNVPLEYIVIAGGAGGGSGGGGGGAGGATSSSARSPGNGISGQGNNGGNYGSFGSGGGGGQVTWTKQTAAATNPGASNARLYFRDGTNANTLKLVVRAGAAGAETTILDNIPT